MAINVKAERAWIVSRLKALGKPGGNPKLQAYIGSPYPVLGLSTPQFRDLHKEFRGKQPELKASEVNALAKALWSGGTWEEKAFAIGILSRNEGVLDESSWRMMDKMVDQAIGWALSDGLASGPVSAYVHSHPAKFKDLIRWTRAEHFWRRRASTYALSEFVSARELDKPFRLLERLLYDSEFWVQRAVGTWLRECWKKDQGRTEAFLRKRVKGLPPVTITVATERASKSFREELRKNSKVRVRKS
jgi:3-methyladenine DNA glycosylase AlkD